MPTLNILTKKRAKGIYLIHFEGDKHNPKTPLTKFQVLTERLNQRQPLPSIPHRIHRVELPSKMPKKKLLHADLDSEELQSRQDSLATHWASFDLCRAILARQDVTAFVESSGHVFLVANLTAAFVLVCDSAF